VGELMLPPVAHGVKTISIGMFLPPAQRGQAIAWRGPMLHRTVAQFVTDVFFGDLDVLLLDMPPGTGDVAISVGQLLPHAEVLVVTTPQQAAAEVAERSGSVAKQTGQRVIGVVENMAGLVQPDGSILEIFGSGGGAETARRLSDSTGAEVPLLGSVPLSVALRQGGDLGVPIVLSDPDDLAAVEIRRIADSLAVRSQSLVRRGLPLTTA
ncbi:MAG: P-loop NTPase, partial [Naasia sp.]